MVYFTCSAHAYYICGSGDETHVKWWWWEWEKRESHVWLVS